MGNSETKSSSAFVVVCWWLFCITGLASGLRNDVYCLRSIMESFEDPHHYLTSSWDFSNQTEGFICRFTGIDCWHPDESRVLNIDLSNMGLEGLFPRGLADCTSLVGLNLSNNQISGPIPSDIDTLLRYTTVLDFSGNSFSGQIPPAVGNMRYLNVLKLDDNHLEGRIPEQIGLLGRLRSFSVANNPLLCGYPLEPCKTKASDSYRSFFISGFAVGWSISTLVVFALTRYYFNPTFAAKILKMKKKKKKKKKKKTKKRRKPAAANIDTPTTAERSNQNKISVLEKFVARISFAEIHRLTNGFHEGSIIGFGKMGTVYKAVLPHGCLLSIKRLFFSPIRDQHFKTELMVLGRFRHKNIVPTIGFCCEADERIIIYKYMSNGNLYDWIHRTRGGGDAEPKILEWNARVKIAIGLARGLAWLHQSNGKFEVVHTNFSSKCVLLDQKFEPKISNLWEAKATKKKSRSFVNGFSKEEDVYAFGIVLLELVIGAEHDKIMTSSSYMGMDGSLVEWIRFVMYSSRLHDDDVFSRCLIGKGFDDEIVELLRISGECIASSPEERPSMLQVHTTLLRTMVNPDTATASTSNHSQTFELGEIVAA